MLFRSLGFCWKHATDTYDSNGDGTPDLPFPRCITLTTGDVVPPLSTPPHNDALYFWCAPWPTPMTLQGSSGNLKSLAPHAFERPNEFFTY